MSPMILGYAVGILVYAILARGFYLGGLSKRLEDGFSER